MDEETESPPSRTQANKMIRVLTGKHQKYTVTVHKLDGTKVEWQAPDHPKTHWCDQSRKLWLVENKYEGCPIMPYDDGMIILCEQNPDWVEKK